MAAVTLTKTALSQVKADAIIVGLSNGRTGPTLVPGAADVDKAFKKQLLETLKAVGATGRAGEVTRIATLGRCLPLRVRRARHQCAQVTAGPASLRHGHQVVGLDIFEWHFFASPTCGGITAQRVSRGKSNVVASNCA